MKRHYRKQSGSGMVLSVAALGIVIGGTVIAVLFIINTGSAMHLKNRVHFMAEQAARYAVGERDHFERREFVRELAATMGLGGRTSSDYDGLQADGQDAMKASVTARISTFGDVAWLPNTIKMSDSAVCTADSGGMVQIAGYYPLPVVTGGSAERLAVPFVKRDQKNTFYPVYAWPGQANMYRIVRSQ